MYDQMKITRYTDLNDHTEVFNFLKTQSQETGQPASVNLWADDWETNSHTLPYLLTNTKRFDGAHGEFFLLYDNDQIVACSGVYISEFNKDIAIAGVRTWVSKDYRHLAVNKDYLLAEHKKWALSHNVKLLALTFNDYNKNIIQIFKRNRLGEKTGRIGNREPKHLFYTGLHEVPFPVKIQHTSQWVIYEKLDASFSFDWRELA